MHIHTKSKDYFHFISAQTLSLLNLRWAIGGIKEEPEKMGWMTVWRPTYIFSLDELLRGIELIILL